MASHTVELKSTCGIFQGLAKQNMLFHQCIGELIDNSIAATPNGEQFDVEIIINKNAENDNLLDLYIVDKGTGMDLELLKKALQLGESATTISRLNEHGFGLKNSLATLSGGNREWKLWTKPRHSNNILTVVGPFDATMEINDDESNTFPNDQFLPSDISTLIHTQIKLSFFQTVQGRGAPAQNLERLREWLIEHLGVMYRGYLEIDNHGFASGSITVSIGTNRIRVPKVEIPFATTKTEHLNITIGGTVYPLQYIHGTLDEIKRDKLILEKKAKFYYQGNQKTQGIDIRLGKRVIATQLFETIFRKSDNTILMTHPDYNDFVGELIIPEVPRGVLTTTNNKTDFNLDDEHWQEIFQSLREFKPQAHIREFTEGKIKTRQVEILNAGVRDEEINTEVGVWNTNVKIDIFRKNKEGRITIYELKVGDASPIHLYQLKMYWDGLLEQSMDPSLAILLVTGNISPNIVTMANQMNKHIPPFPKVHPYNFQIEQINKELFN